MNPIRKTLAAAVLTGLAAALCTAPALAGNRGGQAYTIEAPVIDAQPRYERVSVSEPREVCWDERVERHVRDERRGSGPTTATVLGTIIGGAIGNNVADSRDRQTARLAGAAIGAAIGRDIGNRPNGRGHGRRVVTTERHCEIEHVSYEEERLTGYRVSYRHDGRTFHTFTERDPGATIRLRVRVAPIE